MKTKILFAALLVTIRIIPVFAQDDWKLQKDKDGIKVYSGSYPDSKIRAIKVVATYEATPAAVANLVMDINTATDWVSHLKSSSLLKRVSQDELYYYAEVSLPWPVANRDFVAHLTRNLNAQTGAITIDGPAVAGYMPEKKGIVRINNSTGKWTITPLENNQVRVEYVLHVDPAGALPSWLVNMFSGEAPMQIFENLKLELKKSGLENTAPMLTSNTTK